MNTETLLTNLSQRGIHLFAENGYLCIDAPKHMVDEDLKRVIAANKARLLAALNPKIEVDKSGPPFKPCSRCHHGHFWLSGNGWQCSDCYPMPAGVFMGETCTVDGLESPVMTTVTRTDLEALRPAWVRCCDCRHHVPSETSPKHGIGGCKVDSLARLRPSPWPGTERRCGEYREVSQ